MIASLCFVIVSCFSLNSNWMDYRISIDISKLNKKMSECEICLYVTYVSGFNLTRIVAVEWPDPKAHTKPTENSIAKYSDTINIGRQNDANLKYLVDKEIPRDEWSLPDLTLDIDCIIEYPKKSLGATVASVTVPKTMSGMSSCHILSRLCDIQSDESQRGAAGLDKEPGR